MIKKLFMVMLFTSKIFSFPPPPESFDVTNTNNSGPGSLREAVANFIVNRDYPFGVGIFFKVPDRDDIVITLESDIIVENADGWIGCGTYGNKTVTITGKGKLIIKSSEVRLAKNIKHIFQPKKLFELAAHAVANMPSNIECGNAKNLPVEVREQIDQLQQSNEQNSTTVFPQKIVRERPDSCLIS